MSLERIILRILLLFGLGILPLLFKKHPIKDWVIIFLLKGFTSSFVDSITTGQGKLKYPRRYLPQYFKINVLFDYLFFPIICVIYNQFTYHSKVLGIILKIFLFSIPMTILEVILEHKTKLIKFNKGWTWYHTLISETLIFLFARVFIGSVRRLTIQAEKNQRINDIH
jgi:hypothetical protein